MVLDSNIDPRTVWFQANIDQDIGFNRNLNIWFHWLSKYDSVYHLGNTATQVAYYFDNVMKKLETHPANNIIGPDEWIDIFINAGYAQATWPSLGETFSQWANDKDFDLLVEFYESTETPGDDNGFAVYLAVQCTDTQWPRRENYIRTENWRTFSKAPLITWDNAWYNAPCQYWPQKASTLVNIDGAKIGGILLIGETLDAATTFEGSLEVRRLFPNARLIGEPGGTTHAGSLNGNTCVDDPIIKYLQFGELPPRKAGDGADVECKPLPQPVPPTPNKLETKKNVKHLMDKHLKHRRRHRKH